MNPNRFVILHHLAPTGEHWDLMLEERDHLATWQMLSEPAQRGACPIECIRISDHRKVYLDYQGPISGGRGVVERVDRGVYDTRHVDSDSWTVHLAGKRLRGFFRLTCNPERSPSRWTFSAV